jgi:hypothetical protein
MYEKKNTSKFVERISELVQKTDSITVSERISFVKVKSFHFHRSKRNFA